MLSYTGDMLLAYLALCHHLPYSHHGKDRDEDPNRRYALLEMDAFHATGNVIPRNKALHTQSPQVRPLPLVGAVSFATFGSSYHRRSFSHQML